MDLTFSIIILLAEGVLGMYLLQRAKILKSTLSFVLSALLMALALGLRALALDYRTLDYINFLSRWVEFFRLHGGFRALKYSVGNYNIPYLYFLALFSVLPIDDLYLIKLLSTLSDVLLAWAVDRTSTRLNSSH